MSFLLLFSALGICFIVFFVLIISNIGSELNDWGIIFTIFLLFVIMGFAFSLNNNFIAKKSLWDEVVIDGEKIHSLRHGSILINEIREVGVNDVSNIYSFHIKTEKGKFKFSCLSFLGDEGGAEYLGDREALQFIVKEIVSLSNLSGFNTQFKKESTSGALFVLASIAMLMLIPGFIFAPHKMIFVTPFVISVYLIILKKRRNR